MILGMNKEQFRRAAGMWGIALCVFASAVGWMFMRFGMAWSIGDLPESDQILHIVPAYIVSEVAMIPIGGHYTMDKKQAADLICSMKPKAVIPTHYGSIVGNAADGSDFQKLVEEKLPGVQVELRL